MVQCGWTSILQYLKNPRRRRSSSSWLVNGRDRCCCCWESKLNRTSGSRSFNLSRPHRFTVIHHEPRKTQPFPSRTPNDTLLNPTLVQWTSSLHQVGVAEVGRVALLQPGKLAGWLVYMLDVCSNKEYWNESSPAVCFGCFLLSVSGEVGVQQPHLTGTDGPALHLVTSPLVAFVFPPVTKRWTLPDRNAERR